MKHTCVYPNIDRFMRDRGMDYEDFKNLCDPASKTAVYRTLIGVGGVNGPTKSTIDTILKATGMTYEEAFAKED